MISEIKQAKTKTELKKARELIKEVFIDEIGIGKTELKKYKDQDVTTYIVLLDGKVVSVVQAIFNNYVKLGWLATRKEYRGKGFAKQLMNYVIEKLKEQEVDEIKINSHIDLVSLYKELGFEKIGRPKPDESGELHVKMKYEK